MKTGLIKILAIFLVFSTYAGNVCADLAGRLDTIVASQNEGKVRIAVHILNPESGAVIYSRNASTPLTPASNMKLITTAAALNYLGPDFLYQTRAGLIGDNLAVIGSGDPLLGDKSTTEKLSFEPRWMLKDICEQLKGANITAINDIIIDSTIFDDERVHPSWPKDELNRWYACEVSGLNYNGNCIEVIAEVVGGRVQLTLDPQTAYVEIINKCAPALKGPDTVWCSRQPGSNVITVMGTCYKRCQPVRVAIDRPPAFFGYLLAEELERTGVTVRGRLIEKEILSDDKLRTVAIYRSSIWDVLVRCNRDSLGLAAESLLKTISASREPNGKGGSWPAGQQIIAQYLLSLGIPPDQFVIDDGSGLSEKNRLTANALATVLLKLYKDPNWERFKQTLAIGGTDGTIEKYFNEPKYKGKVFAKTGYIEGVKALSGVCSTSSGDRIFSIITNNTNGATRQAINDIVKAIIDESRQVNP
jgi:D-alanyl-D-alanine carboxypeptidase/D-alanyl-D-alanine-endopeptidase (penicillin-binding protein 4)